MRLRALGKISRGALQALDVGGRHCSAITFASGKHDRIYDVSSITWLPQPDDVGVLVGVDVKTSI